MTPVKKAPGKESAEPVDLPTDIPPSTAPAQASPDAKSGSRDDNAPSQETFTLKPATAPTAPAANAGDNPALPVAPVTPSVNAIPHVSANQTTNPPIDFTAATAQPQVSAPQSTATLQQNFQQAFPVTTTAPETPRVMQSSTNTPVQAAATPESTATPMIENARFIQTPDRSEMHVGIKTDGLGTVDVHAVMRTDAGGTASVGASITVQSHEAQAALAKELPALQGHLEQHNVHVGEISVIPESLSAGSGMMQDQHAQQQQQPQSYSRQTQSNAYLADSSANSASNAAPETSAPVWTVADGRLSVMA